MKFFIDTAKLSQMIFNWKREFICRGAEIFSTKAPDEEAAKREKALFEKIGRLEVEVNFALAFNRRRST
jgi:hypothetical protein